MDSIPDSSVSPVWLVQTATGSYPFLLPEYLTPSPWRYPITTAPIQYSEPASLLPGLLAFHLSSMYLL